jgi:hypothetical protein
MSQLAVTFPPPCITSDLAGVVCQPSRMASSSIRGRARVGVEMCYSHRANPHPKLPPARGKGQLCSNGVLL